MSGVVAVSGTKIPALDERLYFTNNVFKSKPSTPSQKSKFCILPPSSVYVADNPLKHIPPVEFTGAKAGTPGAEPIVLLLSIYLTP